MLSGDCVELGEDELPYAPLLTALRPLVREADPALEALPRPLRSALDAILPGLGAGSSGEEATQSRVFEALLALLESLADPAPVVLVVEDLHWADSSTRSFVGFLARTICTERLLVLGTYRSDELHRRHPLRPLLAELTSDPYARLHRAAALHASRSWPSSSRASSPGAQTRSSWSACTRAARATPCSPRRSSRPASTAAARFRRRCATR